MSTAKESNTPAASSYSLDEEDPALRLERGKRKDGMVEGFRKSFYKDTHKKIIHCTCSDNVQKPYTVFPGQDDTCMNEAAAAGCQHTITLSYCTYIHAHTQRGKFACIQSNTVEQLLRFCAQTQPSERERCDVR
ncbi:hypothetical protein JOB18_032487 [Solea senegalensis]|uniref:Uncharacterized protein n=1 Tax=Solea senegalensis TaxID=28829 RepID=A0AAV6RSX3_SOLSE|nr:hypothetical protein JOB18_032487 [Solea senegalensis]